MLIYNTKKKMKQNVFTSALALKNKIFKLYTLNFEPTLNSSNLFSQKTLLYFIND